MAAEQFRVTFADKLTALRVESGLTPQQLADKTGVPLATIRRLEAGKNKRSPSWGLVVRLAAGVGVPCRVFSVCWEQEEQAGETR
ncbi:helix-turn-helix domain-containing protein [Limnoglobus roseus]|uniref:XRE family transcriptional regulator n=1 Tax=Limnoglobus roseus TaxID=2598579 RepID=A0A5C1AFW3_9BACT|nr:helix-turn-helix transcriptional regulator [Limnoglobus roseus]QEL17103.1 XRE family transcriptional regulator [Limnoglobus roseus]